MISRAQQILIKRAQREAGLSDHEYREGLALISGCRSTTDPGMTDRHIDLALAYFEAIYWRKVDQGELQEGCSPDAVFRQRGYWAAKNKRGNTSRGRYTASQRSQDIEEMEAALAKLGFNEAYCAAIRKKVTAGQADPHALYLYRNALRRTLRAKQAKTAASGSG
jgi:hypothetical protein